MVSGYPDYATRVGSQGGLRNVSPMHGYSETAAKAIPLNANQDGSLFVIACSKKEISGNPKIIPLNLNAAGDLNVTLNYQNNAQTSHGTSIDATDTIANTLLGWSRVTDLLYLRIKNTGSNKVFIFLGDMSITEGTFNSHKFELAAGDELTIQGSERGLANITDIHTQCSSGETTTVTTFAISNQGSFSASEHSETETDDESDKAADWS